jgi:hypothetical protein
MDENTEIRITAEAFAKIVIERWEQKIMRLGINSTGKLLGSFTHYVNTQANGNVNFIQFTYEFYGRFVDMGVGKGVKYGEVELSKRKAKPWYSKIFFSQIIKLREILVNKYQEKAEIVILNTYSRNL